MARERPLVEHSSESIGVLTDQALGDVLRGQLIDVDAGFDEDPGVPLLQLFQPAIDPSPTDPPHGEVVDSGNEGLFQTREKTALELQPVGPATER